MNRKSLITKILTFAAAVLVLAVPLAAYATDLTVTADSTSVKAGDNVTVTVTVSGERLAVVTGAFTYDPAMLSYASSNGGASDGHINLISGAKGGASSLTAVIKFKAIGAGDAVIDVSLESVLDYDGQALENAGARVSVSVLADAVPVESGGEATAQPPDISLTGVAARNVMGAKGDMYIWRSLGSLTLPSGFYDRQVEYGGEFVGGAAIPDSDDMILLYLSENTGENAGYYIYDKEKDILYPYLTIMSVLKNYTLIWPDDTVQVPEGYEETALLWKEKEVPAWIQEGSDGTVYLVRARDSSGEKAFYLYNAEDESMQRFTAQPLVKPEPEADPAVSPPAKPVSAPEEEKEGYITVEETLFYAVCGGGAFLLVLSIVLLILLVKKGAGRKSADNERPEEEAAENNSADTKAMDIEAADIEAADKEGREEKAADKASDDKKAADKKDREKRSKDKKSSDKKAKDNKDRRSKTPATDEGKKVIYVRDAKL